jgi:cellulose synthase/poly-beta-1,6-N-acetylglucosamine synthase-like glycosyltransferase
MIQLQDIHFTIFHYVLVSVLLVAWIYQMYYYFRYQSAALRRRSAERKGRISYIDKLPPVSVIIAARDADDRLRKFLPEVLKQDYPNFEVIVVNDGASEETEFLLRDLKQSYPNLKSTFVPHGTTNISTKKLALTLGIKAAAHDWLLFTDADCIPESNSWIKTMARNFRPGVEIVLGYGAYLNQKGMLNRMITYDTLFIAMQYLGLAKAGKAYMGVGRNLAYHKSVYQRSNGFVPHLHLPSGDDDLFVNRATNRTNTRMESALESITWSEPKTSFKSWLIQKERHLSVSSHYTIRSRFRLLIEPATRALFYLTTLLSIISLLVVNYWIGLVFVGVLFMVRFLTQLILVNKNSRMFNERNYNIDILLFDIFLPIVTFYLLVFGRGGRKARYLPWQ